MKQFISTKLFRTLRGASQKGIDIDAHVLENSYDAFASALFSENASNQAAYRNALVYTRVELSNLTGVSGKKCGNLSLQSH
jgi:hypothetical protein